MAKVSVEVIEAIRQTAKKIGKSEDYQWGHMGACNCGFLVQEITHLNKSEIHQRAMQGFGDWTEQLNDYCPTSGLPMDDVISVLLRFGFDIDDLKHLERLSDKKILERLPTERHLAHNRKQDVATYLNTWASVLEDALTDQITLDLQPAGDLVR